MMRVGKRSLLMTIVIFLLSVGIIVAQAEPCADIVERAFSAVDRSCQETGRNEVCYGNIALDAIPQAQVRDFNFSHTGDIENVSRIQSLQLHGMDEARGEWGLALMRLQATLPESLPGQNATIILFGDVGIERRVDMEQNPMQAFFLETGLGHPRCSEVPQHGLIVQTPHGAGEVKLNINGLDVVMGSTVLFQAQAGEAMQITTIEGSAVIEMDGQQFPVLAGTQVSIPLDDNLNAIGTPSLPESYAFDDVAAMPTSLLEREIEIAPPMPSDRLEQTTDLLVNGLAPCGIDELAACDTMLPVLARLTDVANIALWDVVYDPVADVIPLAANTLDTVENTVENTVDNTVDAVGNTVDTVVEPVGNIVEEPIEAISSTVDTVTEPVGEAVDEVLDPIEDITEPVDEILDPIEDITEPVDEILDPIEDITEPVGEILEPIGDITDPITDPLDDLLNPGDEDDCDPGLLGLFDSCDD